MTNISFPIPGKSSHLLVHVLSKGQAPSCKPSKALSCPLLKELRLLGTVSNCTASAAENRFLATLIVGFCDLLRVHRQVEFSDDSYSCLRVLLWMHLAAVRTNLLDYILVSVFIQVIILCLCDVLSSAYLLLQPFLLMKCFSSCDTAVTGIPARDQHRVILLSFLLLTKTYLSI